MQISTKLPDAPAAKYLHARSTNHSHRKTRIEIALTLVALAITVGATLMFLRESLFSGEQEFNRGEPWALTRLGIFVCVVLLLVYGNIVY